MKDYNAGHITRLCADGQFIAATGITGAVDAHTQGNYKAEGLSQNGAAHKTKATPKDRQCANTKPVQDNRKSTITATCAGEEKELHLTICNQYVGEKVWCSLVAVYDHFSAISRMRHAANNGAVCASLDGVGLWSLSLLRRTPRRPSMVLLVGERSRSLACLFDLLYMLASIPTPASDATSTTTKKHLRTYNGLSYVHPALYKTGAGRENPCKIKATPDAESVFFCVCYMCHSMAWYAKQQGSYNRRSPAILSYHAANNGVMCSYRCAGSYPLAPMSTSRHPIMVALAGQPEGWPVSSNAGSLNPINVTAPIEIETSSGDSVNLLLEAV